MNPRWTFEDDEPPAKIPGWALTYIDLMWLLLLFFILRSAVSEVSTGPRYREMVAALKRQFGSSESSPTIEKHPAPTNAPIQNRSHYSERVRKGVDDEAEETKRALQACGTISFAPESEKLQSEQRQNLQVLAERIARETGSLEIRAGTTDSVPGSDKEMRATASAALARCLAVRDYLIKLGIDPGRLRIALNGERVVPGERPQVQIYSVTEIVAEKPTPTTRSR